MATDNTLPFDSSAQAILAIETSTPAASVALWVDGSFIYQKDFTSDRNHNSMIFEPLAEALGLLGERGLSCVLVGTGPGSYSGARTGIAAGQGVALTHGCAAVGLGSLAATPLVRGVEYAVAVGDARRGLYYVAEITDTGEAGEPELMELAEFQTSLRAKCDGREVVLFTLDDASGAWLEGVELPGEVVVTAPHASGLVDIWVGLDGLRQTQLMELPLAPTYLRPPFTSKAKSGHPLIRS